MYEIPILRAGTPYTSLSTQSVNHFVTGEPIARVSQANRGLISHDLLKAARNREKLAAIPFQTLLEICKKAADAFENDDLPLGDKTQSHAEYIDCLSATTGMPKALCLRNSSKITKVMREMQAVLGGLTRDLDLSILDKGWRKQNGQTLSFACESDALGEILPSNSPGVHSLWVPAIALKVPVVLKPGRQEPWTPYRIAQAFIAAGAPKEAFSYYPTDHGGAQEILMRCGRSMLFGDKSTVAPWTGNPGIQIHGPGWSKVVIGEDEIHNWRDYLDIIVESASANGGRSCINASGLWVPSHGREIAEALAERMAGIVARSLDDPDAAIAAFANKKFASMLDRSIDAQLADGEAIDLTAKYRKTPRHVEIDGAAYLQPTVIWSESASHALAHAEYLFPFISVVEVPQDELIAKMGSTLIATAITKDQNFIRDLFGASNIDRLNIGPVPTMHISWDQPHEGNLFEHLYRQRSLQMSPAFEPAAA